MKTKQRDRWAKTRRMGRTRFVVIWGVLYWGILTALLYSLIMSIIGERSFLETALVSVPLFMIGGIGWGLWVWHLAEKSYAKHLAKLETTT